MLLFIGEGLAVHVQKFRPAQAHPDGAHLPDSLKILGQFDIRLQCDRHPVPGLRRRFLQPDQAGIVFFLFFLLRAVMAQAEFVGVNQQGPRVAVDDDEIILAQETAGLAQADNRRKPKAAGQDGGVRSGASIFGGKGHNALALQHHRVSGRQVGGDDDAPAQVAGDFFMLRRLLLQQDPLYAVNHMADVVLTGAQVGVVHFLEGADQGVPLQFQSPFRIAPRLPDQLQRLVGQGGILQHQQVRVYEGGDVNRQGGRDLFANGPQLLFGLGDGRGETLRFGFDLLGLDAVLGNVGAVLLNDMDAANGGAAGNPQAVQGGGHCSSPNLSRISVFRAARALFSSGPLTVNSRVAPFAAVNIISPIMLLPSAVLPFTFTSMSEANSIAVCTKRAAARACNPS